MLTAATVLTKQTKHTTAATQARGNERQTPNTLCCKAVYYYFTTQLSSHLTENTLFYYKEKSDNVL